ncbi:MAG: PPOX class F420-dependent oxidoreductase [Actinobacteria bacterium]|nr:PPOX class F420-dependent oxidoreductase [Actinomycetota bacterium]NIT98829.1 PPOX class F420-dependent oxidoreductase [Actinomycetota bacterium]NIU22449.1 PPOX class F420-dependent oxidoreductase [Actinomycetota bacterium]NIU71125.1 PPOX class F420-dependent oxidoreductase [Actinomycetota bacterium]NIV59027.1 PPOX class F420-dependent oxidoreductase [Actinomycetota bacterium]
MTAMSAIADEKYLQLTTFTRDGTPKQVPVWVVGMGDGTLGFTTALDTWKVKRIRHTPGVELVPSNARGVPKDGATPVEGTAEVVTGSRYEEILSRVKAKYGWQVGVVRFIAKLRRQEAVNCAVVVTLDS